MSAMDMDDDKPLIDDDDFDKLTGTNDSLLDMEADALAELLRVSHSSESDEEKESDEKKSSDEASPPPKKKKKRLLKRMRDSDDDDGAVSTTAGLLKSFKRSLPNFKSDKGLNGKDNEDDEEHDPPNVTIVPNVLKQDDAVRKNTTQPQELMEDLFNDEDFDADDEADLAPAKSKRSPIEKDTNASDDSNEKNAEETPARATASSQWHRGEVHEGWPICAGRISQLTVRCTYATRSAQWSAFTRLDKSGTAEGIKPPALPHSDWGVFAPHQRDLVADAAAEKKRQHRLKLKLNRDAMDVDDDDDDDDMDRSAKAQRESHRQRGLAGAIDDASQVKDDGDDGDGDGTGSFVSTTLSRKTMLSPPEEQPWIVIVGSDEMMHALSSPFFSNEVRLVALDDEIVQFCFNRYATVWYAYELTNKTPLWPVDYHFEWSLHDMTRLLTDTLYAHMLCGSSTSQNSREETTTLGYILASIAGFPIHQTAPHLKLLSPARVPLNYYSERKARKAVVVELVARRVGAQSLGAAKASGLPTVLSSQLANSFVAQRPMGGWLFADIEKPPSIWIDLMHEHCIPAEVLSAQTNWRNMNHVTIMQIFDTLTTILGTRVLSKPERLLSVAAQMRLDTRWFAQWFDSFETDTSRATPTERLHFYAIFCASEMWHRYMDQYRTFSSHVLDFPDRLLMETWCSLGRHALSETVRMVHTLDHGSSAAAKASQPPIAPLPVLYEGDDPTDAEPLLTVEVYNRLKELCEHPETKRHSYLASQPVFVATASGVSQAQLVDERIVARCKALCRFITEITLRWARIRHMRLLDKPFDALPPLVVQSTAVYGPASDESTNAFYRLFEERAPVKNGGRAFIVRFDDDAVAVRKTLKEALPTLYVLIFDRMHLWQDTLIDAVLDVLGANKTPKCAHLLVTAHAHTLVHETGSGLLLEDLTAVADLSARALDIGDANGAKDVSDGGTAPPLPESFTQTWLSTSFGKDDFRWWRRGMRTALHYDPTLRQSQFASNATVLQRNLGTTVRTLTDALCMLENARKMAASNMSTTLQRRGATSMTPPLLILFARQRAQTILQRELMAVTSVSNAQEFFQCVSYEQLARLPANVAGRRTLIVLCDLDYKGAGRPVCQQINAAFERLLPQRSAILAWKDRSGDASKNNSTNLNQSFLSDAETKGLLHDAFFANDQKSDRYEAQPRKFSLLKQQVANYFDDPRVRKMLRPPNA